MNAKPFSADLEIVTLPIGNGWRVRIADGEHLQFIGGFGDRHEAEDWIHRSASDWIAKLKRIAGSL